MPDHQAVVAAVTDPELSRWVARRETYLLVPAELPLGQHPVFRLTAIEISHPMSVYLVDVGGRLVVTSDTLDGIASLVRHDPSVFEGPGGAELLVELASPVAGATRLIASDSQLTDITARAAHRPPRISRTQGRWEAELFVVDDLDRLRRWHLVVPDSGAPSWDRATIAQGVQVAP